MNETTGNLKEYKTKLDTEFADIQVKNEIFPVYFNAWEYDFNRDLLIAFIYNLINDMDLDILLQL